ncbi:MAG: OmpA family protein [Almyronema sp.]
MIEDGTAAENPRNPEPIAVEESWLRSLLVFWVRLLLLGVSSTLAWLVGLLIAQFFPAPATSSPPLQESVSRQGNRIVTKLQQLPQWWQQGNTAPQVIVPNSIPATSAAGDSSEAASRPDLTPAERETIAAELSALRNELASLGDRAAELETQVGQSRSPGALEDRLEAIAAAITPLPAPSVSQTADPSLSRPLEPLPNATPSTLPLPKITLPGQVLFAADSTQLRPEAEPLLTALLPDLRTYPGATILIGAHTEPKSTVDESRQLSFLQATAVRRYLAAQLGEGYRWLPIGYGQTRPVGGDRAAQSYRIELVIIPAD